MWRSACAPGGVGYEFVGDQGFVLRLEMGQALEIAGITRNSNGGWMKQIARNLLDPDDGILRGKGYLVMDRAPVFTEAFREMLGRAGVKPLRLPARSPNLNAFAERFVLSVRSECLWPTTTWSGTIKEWATSCCGRGLCQRTRTVWYGGASG